MKFCLLSSSFYCMSILVIVVGFKLLLVDAIVTSSESANNSSCKECVN